MKPHLRLEWDEAKRLSNIRRHRIDFAELKEVFDNAPYTIFDDRYHYGEERLFTLGLLKGRVVAISHTQKDNLVRVISARRAKNEEITYFKEIWN